MYTENKTNPEDKNKLYNKHFVPVKLNLPDDSEPDDPNLSSLFGDTDFKEVNPFIYEKDLLLKKETKFELLMNKVNAIQNSISLPKNINKRKIAVVSASTAAVLAFITVGSSLRGDKSSYRADAVVISKIVSQNINSKTEDIKTGLAKSDIYNDKGFTVYKVQKGESLSDIAKKFSISEEVIAVVNNLNASEKLTESLVIPLSNGKIHKVAANETLETIAIKYKMTTDALIAVNKNSLKNPHFLQIDQPVFIPESIDSKQIKSLETALTQAKPKKTEKTKAVAPVKKAEVKPEGYVHILRAGETPGHLAARYGVPVDKILLANNISNPLRLQIGQKLVIPGSNFSRNNLSSRSMSAGKGISVSSGRMSWPSAGGYVSSNYGYRGGSFHKGMDIAASIGTGIKAAMSGTVVYAGWEGAYGNSIHIRHANGLMTRYAHCSRLYVAYGQSVSAGQLIGAVGTTGRSTGPHLHFEVIANGRAVNPRNYF